MGVKIQLLTLMCIIIPVIVADGDYYPCQHRWSSDLFFNLFSDKVQPIQAKNNKHKADLMVSQLTNLRTVISSKPTGVFDTQRPHPVRQSSPFCDGGAGHMTHVADMDGDGYDDLLCRKVDGKFSVRYHRVNNFMAEQDFAKDFECASTSRILLGDFDGNLADDILCYDPLFSAMDGSPIYFSKSCNKARSLHHRNSFRGKASYGRHHAFKMHRGNRHNPHCDEAMSSTLAVGALAKCNIPGGDKMMALDANGDGMDDIACFIASANPNPDNVYTYLSVGVRNGLVFSTQTTGVAGCIFDDSVVLPADIDGDGDDDLLCLKNDVSAADNVKVVFYKLSGYEAAGFSDTNTNLCSPAPNMFCSSPTATAPIYHAADYNNDGHVDIMCRFDSSGTGAGPMFTRIVYSEHFSP